MMGNLHKDIGSIIKDFLNLLSSPFVAATNMKTKSAKDCGL
jgi:hypothetical protein